MENLKRLFFLIHDSRLSAVNCKYRFNKMYGSIRSYVLLYCKFFFCFFGPGKLKYEKDRLHKSYCAKAPLQFFFFPVKRSVYTFYSRQIKPKGSDVLRVMFLDSAAFLFSMSPT